MFTRIGEIAEELVNTSEDDGIASWAAAWTQSLFLRQCLRRLGQLMDKVWIPLR